MSIEPGMLLGSYRILSLHRSGGMADVYRAQDVYLDKEVAVKVIRLDHLSQAEYAEGMERFRGEPRKMAEFRHPNIIKVYRFGEVQGVPYIVMDFVDGGTLAERLGTPKSVHETVRVLRPIADALDYAHGRQSPVFHRDVKPSNILLWSNGTPVLADFGIAKQPDNSRDMITRGNRLMGTPEYMAPEQVLGIVGPATDQYALAIVAFEMLTGRVPFDRTNADTPLGVAMAHVHKPLPPPRSVNPALTAATERALLKALDKRPEQRYPSVSAFITVLGAAAGTRREPEPWFVRWLPALGGRKRIG